MKAQLVRENMDFQRGGDVKSSINIGITRKLEEYNLKNAAIYFDFDPFQLEKSFKKTADEIYLLGVFYSDLGKITGVAKNIIEMLGGAEGAQEFLGSMKETNRLQPSHGNLTVGIESDDSLIMAEYLSGNESIYFWGDIKTAIELNLADSYRDWHKWY